MRYTAALEALDAKVGKVHTMDDWRRVGEKSVTAPAMLTDDDLTIIEGFSGEKAANEARARRTQALTPPQAPRSQKVPSVRPQPLRSRKSKDSRMKLWPRSRRRSIH